MAVRTGRTPTVRHGSRTQLPILGMPTPGIKLPESVNPPPTRPKTISTLTNDP